MWPFNTSDAMLPNIGDPAGSLLRDCRAEIARLQRQLEAAYLTDPLALAVLFHVTYERLAPRLSYETRKETRIFDPESLNGKLMIATCAEIQKAIKEDTQ